MTRLLIRIFALLAVLPAAVSMRAAPPLSGGGTEANPYLITSKADVMALADYVNGHDDGTTATNSQAKAGGDVCAGLYFAITADIDMGGDTTFLGIGTVTNYHRTSSSAWKFSGHIDGRGHTVRNLRVNGMVFKADGSISTTSNTTTTGSRKYIGFIGILEKGSVRNLHFDVTCSVTSNGYAGMIAGRAGQQSVIENCTVAGVVRSYGDNAGGIAGDLYATSSTSVTVKGCRNSATVYCNTKNAGGIAGGAYYASVGNCLNTGRVELHSFHTSKAEGEQEHGGGIIGYWQAGTSISGCMNTGVVSVSKQYAGGIAGRSSSATKCALTGCVSLGYVDCPSLAAKGMISGNLASTSLVPAGNYYDASLWGNAAISNKEAPGCTGLVTQDFISGTMPSGLEASLWLCEAGLYPRLKLGSDLTLAAAQTYLLFTSGTDALNFGSEAEISTKGSVTATVVNEQGSDVFSVSGGKILAADCKKVANATATLVNGDYSLSVPLTKIPKLFAGSGSESDPYIISSRTDLENMASMTNGAMKEHYAGIYFRQTADIDMGGQPFEGIACVQTGTNYPERTYWFAGIYDGGGHKISNLVIDRVKFNADGTAMSYTTGGGSAQNVGLFGSLGDGARVKNVQIVSGSVRGYFNVGSIAGWTGEDVQITDCYNAASVTGYYSTVGGFVGESENTAGSSKTIIARCVNSGPVLGNGDDAGGIIGYNKSILTDCINLGSVTLKRFNGCLADAITAQGAGGIAGTNQGNMTYCANFGAVSGIQGQVGGLTGFSSSGAKRGDIIGCYNAGQVSAGNMVTCGALIGEFFNILSSNGTQRDCAYDSQYSGAGACDNADVAFAIPLSTADLVSGEAYLPADGWIMQRGFYPINKALSGNAAIRAACASYVLMPEGETARNFRSGTVSNAMPLTASIAGSDAITLAGNTISTDATSRELAVATVTLTTDGCSRVLSLQYVPDVLSGTGTQADPFLVTSADDFNKLATQMLQGTVSYRGKYFRQTADIDFSGSGFTMAAQHGNYFAGNYDGGGHSVSNVTMNADEKTDITSVGLFGGIAQGGSVANLTLKGFNITANSGSGLLAGVVAGSVSNVATSADCRITGVKSTVLFSTSKGKDIGGIAGIINGSGRIENCRNAATVTAYKYAGGIVGNSDYSGSAYISGCENSGTVLAMEPKETQPPTGSGQPTTKTVEASAGGIAGQMAGTISKCVNTGTVLADPCKVAGGIVGTMYVRTMITDCENRGSVQARDYTAGGIAGQSGTGTSASPSSIVNCRNYTPVKAMNQLGGIVGIAKAYLTVQGCANYADLTPGGQWCGGIAGDVVATVSGYDPFVLIESCYNTGSISGNGYNGGIAGRVTTAGTRISKCFNAGAITTTNTIGGPAGIANTTAAGTTVTNCYNAGEITGPRYAGGIIGNTAGVTVMNCYSTGKVTGTRDTYLETNTGNVVSTFAETNTVTNCYALKDMMFTADELYDVKGMTSAELFTAPLGDAYVKHANCFPLLTTLDTVPAAKVFAAYYTLRDGDTPTHISHSFPIGQLEGLTWTATGNLRIDGDRVRPDGVGTGTITASCGDFSRSYTFSSTTGVESTDASDPVVRVEYYLPDGTRAVSPAAGTTVIAVYTTASGRRSTAKQIVR